MIDVEQRALRALEQDALAGAAMIVQHLPDPVHIGQVCLSATEVSSPSIGLRINLALAEAAAQRIVMGKQPLDLGRQRVDSARSMTRIARRPTLSS